MNTMSLMTEENKLQMSNSCNERLFYYLFTENSIWISNLLL